MKNMLYVNMTNQREKYCLKNHINYEQLCAKSSLATKTNEYSFDDSLEHICIYKQACMCVL